MTDRRESARKSEREWGERGVIERQRARDIDKDRDMSRTNRGGKKHAPAFPRR